MSRDWYIQTDKRNVQDTFDEIDCTPLSFREKWQKYHKKYILWGIEAVAVILLLLAALPPLLRQDPPDYTVTILAENTIPEAGRQFLSERLSSLGEDRDGDGKVEVSVRAIAVGDAQSNANDQRHILLSSFLTPEYTLFAMEPGSYDRYVRAYAAEPTGMFVKLTAPAEQLTEEGTLFVMRPGTESLPETLWVGVRILSEEDAAQAAHTQLLQALISALSEASEAA